MSTNYKKRKSRAVDLSTMSPQKGQSSVKLNLADDHLAITMIFQCRYLINIISIDVVRSDSGRKPSRGQIYVDGWWIRASDP